MMEYVKTWLALMADRRAVTSLDYTLIAGVLAVALLTEAALGALAMH